MKYLGFTVQSQYNPLHYQHHWIIFQFGVVFNISNIKVCIMKLLWHKRQCWLWQHHQFSGYLRYDVRDSLSWSVQQLTDLQLRLLVIQTGTAEKYFTRSDSSIAGNRNHRDFNLFPTLKLMTLFIFLKREIYLCPFYDVCLHLPSSLFSSFQKKRKKQLNILIKTNDGHFSIFSVFSMNDI